MSDASSTDRHPTDEPEGVTAHQASLRPAGRSVSPGSGDAEPPADDFDQPVPDGPPPARESSRAGYDTADVSGDSPEYRPDE
jgi:hypothetical protein